VTATLALTACGDALPVYHLMREKEPCSLRMGMHSRGGKHLQAFQWRISWPISWVAEDGAECRLEQIILYLSLISTLSFISTEKSFVK
jgi:hypothetical protein